MVVMVIVTVSVKVGLRYKRKVSVKLNLYYKREVSVKVKVVEVVMHSAEVALHSIEVGLYGGWHVGCGGQLHLAKLDLKSVELDL
ncbi:hypothetical protein LR48_Vigan08g024300 [Vigna angularis]|uniref:Uncharacterized protein n=1 Tax=Phaseolus angularis TaxID=3914 RepID=A0A0L9V372_PHAAN|nr:hypothetical protein LR48_Vigan08g024300 [Vigna angularis]